MLYQVYRLKIGMLWDFPKFSLNIYEIKYKTNNVKYKRFGSRLHWLILEPPVLRSKATCLVIGDNVLEISWKVPEVNQKAAEDYPKLEF